MARKPPKTVIHIHQQKLRKGEAAIIVRTYRGSQYARHVRVGDVEVLQPENPLSCGARAYIETYGEVEILA